jgi:integrase
MIGVLPRVSHFVFSTRGNTPISGWSKAKITIDREIKLNNQSALPPWRIHDLRRTVATGLQRLGIGLQVVEAVLGHISGSRAGVVGVYQRHGFNEEKRAALEAWSREIERINKSASATEKAA